MTDEMNNNIPIQKKLEFELGDLKEENECYIVIPDVDCLCKLCRDDKLKPSKHIVNDEVLEIKYLQFQNSYYIVWVKEGTNKVIIGWRIL